MKVRVVLSARHEDRLRRLVEAQGGHVVRSWGSAASWGAVAEEDLDVLVVDRGRLGTEAGPRVREVRDLPGGPEVIVVADGEDPADRAGLLASGALGVLHAGLPDEVLGPALGALFARRRAEQLRRLRTRPDHAENGLGDFASSSPALCRVVETARRVVSSGSSILILGETGVGKEWRARAIHHEGPRSAGPFVAVNCGALPESLLESELFGHERGAFTGAIRAHRGHFETAHLGTLFLDEIGEMPVHLQVKLLRVLQERRVQRLGSERAIDVDLRVMAATNRNPLEAIARGRLREDLYYRLAVVTLTLPPLRERLDDLPALAIGWLERFSRGFRRDVRGISAEAMAALLRYPWPGNLRELINVIERAVLLASEGEILLEDLPEEIARGRAPGPALSAARPESLAPGGVHGFHEARRRAILGFERGYLTGLLERTGGRVGEAAARAGVSVRTLHSLLKRNGLRKEDFKYRG